MIRVRQRWRLITFIALVIGNFNTVTYATNLRTVALSGQPAPGTAGGAFGQFLSHWDLNDAGRVVFLGELQSPPPEGGGRLGFWSDEAGQLELIVRNFTPAPGMPAANISDLRGGLSLNNHGHIAFIATLTGPAGFQGAVYSNASGKLEAIAFTGMPVPSTPVQANFESFGQVHLDDHGRVVIVSVLEANGTHFGALRGDDQDLSLLLSSLTQAPGMPAGTVFARRGSINVLANRFGQIAVSAALANQGSFAPAGVWSDRTGQFSLVARNGDTSPSGLPGETYGTSNIPAFNDLGELAYRVQFAGPNVTTGNDEGIVLHRANSAQIFVREGDTAPGTGNEFTSILTDPSLNNAGQVAFAALVNSSAANDSGLWAGTAENLTLVARESDPAPGVPPGVLFTHWLHDVPPINDFGQIAFIASLRGPAVTPASDRGIWATDLAGNLHLIAREGDTIEVAPNDHRVVELLNLRESGSDVFDPPKLNNRGQIVFRASFVDGSRGIFISNAVAVPEPSLIGSLSVIAVFLGCSRRGRTPPCRRWSDICRSALAEQ